MGRAVVMLRGVFRVRRVLVKVVQIRGRFLVCRLQTGPAPGMPAERGIAYQIPGAAGDFLFAHTIGLDQRLGKRSEERRVGKECRSRRSPEHEKKKKKQKEERECDGNDIG